MYRIACAEIWGGIRGDDLAVSTSGVRASLFARACDGGKGGDVYYFSVCSSDLLTRIAIADVMGHGAAVSETSQWLFDSLKQRMNSAQGDEVLADLNQLTAECGYKAMSTAVVAAFYRSDGNLYYCYAGHHPILIRRTSDHFWTEATIEDRGEMANLPLGVDDSAPFDQANQPFATGDLLFLYTDGLIEAPNGDDGQFGLDRLRGVLDRVGNAEPDTLKSAVVTALMQHTGGSLAHDDVTFMAVQIR